MTSSEPSPAKVSIDAARRRQETADGGFEIGVLIDVDSHGSEVLLGVETIAPGTEPVSWTADEKSHEVYYVQSGSVRIRWDGAQPGEEVLGPTDSFYFPPGLTYEAVNVGQDAVEIVWSLTPSPRDFFA